MPPTHATVPVGQLIHKPPPIILGGSGFALRRRRHVLAVGLGVSPERIETIISFAKVADVGALDRVADAYEQLEQRHTHGKIVLLPT